MCAKKKIANKNNELIDLPLARKIDGISAEIENVITQETFLTFLNSFRKFAIADKELKNKWKELEKKGEKNKEIPLVEMMQLLIQGMNNFEGIESLYDKMREIKILLDSADYYKNIHRDNFQSSSNNFINLAAKISAGNKEITQDLNQIKSRLKLLENKKNNKS